MTLTHYIRSGGYFIPKIQHTYSSFEKFLFRWLPGWIQLNRFNLLQEHDRMWSIKTFGNDPGREAFEKDLLEYLREKAPAEYLEALTPHYPLGAKRPAFDYGWLDSLHRDNVTLVNTDLASVKPNGIVTADGKLREHDVIIWATGSDVPHHGLGENVNLHGEDGKELQAYWKEVGGPEAYAGLAVPGVRATNVDSRLTSSFPTTSQSLVPTAPRDPGAGRLVGRHMPLRGLCASWSTTTSRQCSPVWRRTSATPPKPRSC